MGYQTEQINTYCDTLNRYIDAIPNSYIRMWRTDNNGQITRPANTNTNDIGQWKLTSKTDKGNDEELIQTCTKHNYICANTHTKFPKIIIRLTLRRGTVLAELIRDKSTFPHL